MEGKDVERLVDAAECVVNRGKPDINDFDTRYGLLEIGGRQVNAHIAKIIDYERAEMIVAVKGHYETFIASERSKVIAEVREWVCHRRNTMAALGLEESRRAVYESALLDKLDSMEPDKGGSNETSGYDAKTGQGIL